MALPSLTYRRRLMLLNPVSLAQGPEGFLWPNRSFLKKGQAKDSGDFLSLVDPFRTPCGVPPSSSLPIGMFYRVLTFPEEENLVSKTLMRRPASLVRSSNTLSAVTESSRMRNCSAPQSSGGLLRKRSKR